MATFQNCNLRSAHGLLPQEIPTAPGVASECPAPQKKLAGRTYEFLIDGEGAHPISGHEQSFVQHRPPGFRHAPYFLPVSMSACKFSGLASYIGALVERM